MKEFFGYGRKRDENGAVVKRFLNPYVNCLHTSIGHARENMEVLIAEFDMGEIKNVVTNGHKDWAPEIIERDTPMKGNYEEPRICTMVGRDPDNPGSRVRSEHYEQFIEMGGDVRNTLTSVQKDNLVAEPFRMPQATRQGYIDVPPGSVFDASYPDSKTRRGRVQEGGKVSPALTASGEVPCLFEGVSVHPFSHALEFKGEKSVKTDVCPALRATDYKAPHCVWENAANYRIRKLTPKECFRLMGVSEGNIERIQESGVSVSRQYKMAGNSIVVDVLAHIFRKLLVDTGQESQQLMLF